MAICGAAATPATISGTVASPSGRRKASCLGEFACRKSARTLPSVGPNAIACSWRRGSRSTRFTPTRKAHHQAKAGTLQRKRAAKEMATSATSVSRGPVDAPEGVMEPPLREPLDKLMGTKRQQDRPKERQNRRRGGPANTVIRSSASDCLCTADSHQRETWVLSQPTRSV